MSIYVNFSKKKLYACFVDFRKAFDLVWQDGLLYKLLKIGVGGNFYSVIKNMYKTSKIRVKTSQGLSKDIETKNGVRQGDCISPLLFNIFINDLPHTFLNNASAPPVLDKETIPALLYADDLIILSETPEGLQNSLNALSTYCEKWKLEVNLSKSNVMIMGKGAAPNTSFHYGRDEIKTTNSYKYLGTIINRHGTFSQATKDLKQKGLKALFSIWKTLSTGTAPPIDLATHLFDTLVKPIILYNCEVWGSEVPISVQNDILNNTDNDVRYLKFINNSPFEQLHLKFIKMTLGVKKHTSNIAARAELGRFPLFIETQINIIKYWLRLVNLSENRLVVDALNANLVIQKTGQYSWTSMVKHILESVDLQHVWVSKKPTNPKQFLTTLRQKLQVKYENLFQKCMHDHTSAVHSNKLRTYKTFKTDHKKENYLNTIKDRNIRSSVSKFRLSSHNLMIEKGRHAKIDISLRICKKCSSNEIEDESHAMLICDKYSRERTELFTELEKYLPNWSNYHIEQKFIELINLKHIPINIGKFIHLIMSDPQEVSVPDCN